MKNYFSRRTVTAAVAAAAILAIAGLFYNRMNTAAAAKESRNTKIGVAYLKSLEAQDPADVDKILTEQQRAKREKQIDALMAQIDKGTVDIWSQFGHAAILGDSRAEGFTAYGFLTTSNVYAKMGASCKKASDYLAAVKKQNPEQIFFTYGTNDMEGMWNSADDYIKAYTAIIQSYQQALPDAEIYVDSIIPVTAAAIQKHPNMKNLGDYNNRLKKMCQQIGAVYVDCSSVMSGHENLYAKDGIHFAPSVYSIWAKKMIRTAYEHEAEDKEKAATGTESAGAAGSENSGSSSKGNGVTDLVRK